jgi:BMFP domain-containing protein YqiC
MAGRRAALSFPDGAGWLDANEPGHGRARQFRQADLGDLHSGCFALREARSIAIVRSSPGLGSGVGGVERAMAQTSNRILDEMARLMNDAAGVAQGVRREFDSVFRAQAERILRDLDIVQREEFEAVKAMAQKAREENESLKARVAELEAAILEMDSDLSDEGPPRPIRRNKPKPSY